LYRETPPKQHFIRQCVGVNEQPEVDDTTLVEAQCCKPANVAEFAECGGDLGIAEFAVPSAECPKNAARGEHRSLNPTSRIRPLKKYFGSPNPSKCWGIVHPESAKRL
jgi:hypothetical protein